MMRYSSAVSAEMLNAMFSQVAVGRTDGDLAAAGYDVAARVGATVYDLAMASGPDMGHLWWSRMPSFDWRRPYATGDIVHPDVYGAVDGYFYDFVRTIVVGGEPTAAQVDILEAAIACIHAACAAAVPGRRAKDLWDISQAELVRRGVVDRAATSPAGAESVGRRRGERRPRHRGRLGAADAHAVWVYQYRILGPGGKWIELLRNSRPASRLLG